MGYTQLIFHELSNKKWIYFKTGPMVVETAILVIYVPLAALGFSNSLHPKELLSYLGFFLHQKILYLKEHEVHQLCQL